MNLKCLLLILQHTALGANILFCFLNDVVKYCGLSQAHRFWHHGSVHRYQPWDGDGGYMGEAFIALGLTGASLGIHGKGIPVA